jgi:hypothetical protein
VAPVLYSAAGGSCSFSSPLVLQTLLLAPFSLLEPSPLK